MNTKKKSRNLTIRFELNDNQYNLFKKKITSLNIRSTASRLKAIKFYYRENEYNGNHLVEIGLQNLNDSSQYDLVGVITRQNKDKNDNYRQTIDLLGQYVNTTKDDYDEIIHKKDIRELPCTVCGKKLKTRRKMYLMIDNETGEYEYVGNECVSKLMPEWGIKSFQDLFTKLIKLQTLFHNARTENIPEINVIDILKEEYNKISHQLEQDTTGKVLDFSSLQKNYINKQHKKLNENMVNIYAAKKILSHHFGGKVLPTDPNLYTFNKNGHSIKILINYIYGAKPDLGYDDKVKQREDNFLKGIEQFQKNLQVVDNQYKKAWDKITDIIKKIPNEHQLISFDESIKLIQSNRQWPNKSGYNLRELLNAQTVKMNMTSKIKIGYDDFIFNKSKLDSNPNKIIDEFNNQFEQQFGNDTFKKLNSLDQSFLKSSNEIDKIINSILPEFY